MPQVIMSMKLGEDLNQLVTERIREFDADVLAQDWTGNAENAVSLWGHAELICGAVSITRFSDSPKLISQVCVIKDQESGAEVLVATASWMESLAKAFLLHCAGYVGQFINPEWDKPIRMVH